MGYNAFVRLCNLSNNNDWIARFHWMESNSNFIKFYCINVNTKYGNEYSYNSKIFTIKKEFPELSKVDAILEASKKMMLPILYTVLTTICAFIINLQWYKTDNRFWINDDAGFNCFNVYNVSSFSNITKYFFIRK